MKPFSFITLMGVQWCGTVASYNNAVHKEHVCSLGPRLHLGHHKCCSSQGKTTVASLCMHTRHSLAAHPMGMGDFRYRGQVLGLCMFVDRPYSAV